MGMLYFIILILQRWIISETDKLIFQRWIAAKTNIQLGTSWIKRKKWQGSICHVRLWALKSVINLWWTTIFCNVTISSYGAKWKLILFSWCVFVWITEFFGLNSANKYMYVGLLLKIMSDVNNSPGTMVFWILPSLDYYGLLTWSQGEVKWTSTMVADIKGALPDYEVTSSMSFLLKRLRGHNLVFFPSKATVYCWLEFKLCYLKAHRTEYLVSCCRI